VALPFSGIPTTLVDFCDVKAFRAALRPNTRLVWIETPTNPTLKICDVKAICEIAHEPGRNITVVVDNTFMTPYFQQPLKLGADIVMHSVTKYLNGHSDVVMGVCVTSSETLYARLKFLQNAIGAVPSPFDCYMAMRGLKTLHLRMREHAKNAMEVAKYLESSPLVDRVIYPGLPSHPQHELAKAQMSGFGGMITFFLKGGLKESRAFLENLHLFVCAESLGAVESLAEHPAIMTHASVPPDQRVKLGISDTMIRLSIGVEDLEDIMADLKGALGAIPAERRGPEEPKKAS
jgi:cystathionine gamma-lyase